MNSSDTTLYNPDTKDWQNLQTQAEQLTEQAAGTTAEQLWEIQHENNWKLKHLPENIRNTEPRSREQYHIILDHINLLKWLTTT